MVFSVFADPVTEASYKFEHSASAPFLDNSAPKQQENDNSFQEIGQSTSGINGILTNTTQNTKASVDRFNLRNHRKTSKNAFSRQNTKSVYIINL